MKHFLLIVLCLYVGFLVGYSIRANHPTVHECISTCMEYYSDFSDTVDYD